MPAKIQAGLALAALFFTAGAAQAQETVLVTANRQIDYPKLTEPLIATPQTITIIPAQIIEDQAAFDLRDALRADPSVSVHADEDSAQGTNTAIRGFSARFDTYLDGMLDVGNYYRDAFYLEQIDVVTGPSSVLFGRGSTGGAILQVSKTPQAAAFDLAASEFGSDGTARLSVDSNHALWNNAAFRANVLLDRGGIAGRDEARYNRIGFAPALAFGRGTATRITLNFLHQSDWDLPDYGLPWIDRSSGLSVPATPPRNSFYGLTSDYSNSLVDVGTARIEHDFNAAVSLRQQIRYGVYAQDYRATDPQILAIVPDGTPLSSVLVTRTIRSEHARQSTLDDQLDFTARFTALGLTHVLTTGIEAARMTASPIQYKFSGVPPATLIDPDDNAAFTPIATLKSAPHTDVDTQGLYALDSAGLGAWTLTAAARLDRFDARYRNAVPTPVLLHHDETQPSFKAALVYALQPTLSFYANFGTSFDPSAEGLSLSPSTADLGAERSTTVESGVKWNPAGTLLVSAALFRTEIANLREASPLDPTIDILAGKARSQGFELLAQGAIDAHWTVLGGYTYLDAKIIASPNNDAGAPLANAPRNSLALWLAYTPDARWRFGAGFNCQSWRAPASVPDANGEREIAPGYCEGNAMIGYRFGAHWQAQLNISNLSDAYYLDAIDDNHINPGAGRTFLLTLRYTQ